MPWLIQHSAWIINRYQVHSDGYTSYRRRFSVDHSPSICQFAELIYFKASDAHSVYKASSSWSSGIWVGLTSESCSHIVVNQTGVFKSRSIRRLPRRTVSDFGIFSVYISPVEHQRRWISGSEISDSRVLRLHEISNGEFANLLIRLIIVKTSSGKRHKGEPIRKQTGCRVRNVVRNKTKNNHPRNARNRSKCR